MSALTWHRWTCPCGITHPVLVDSQVTCMCGAQIFVDSTFPIATDDDLDRDRDEGPA